MLYNFFRIVFGMAALFALFYMIYDKDYEYIFFIVTILLWCIYSFFRENDNEYLRRENIDPETISWFFPSMYEPLYTPQQEQYDIQVFQDTTNSSHYRYMPSQTPKKTTAKEKTIITNKLKKKVNLKITIDSDNIRHIEKK